VPTSLLVERDGRVVWLDQSADYTQRSAPEVVRVALERLAD